MPRSLATAVAPALGRGVPDWIRAPGARGALAPLACIAGGGALYGAAIGAWRDPLLGLYVAIKLPLVLAATAVVDALANGLWARRLGIDLSLAQSLRAVLTAFALAALVLGSLAPVVLLFDLTLPAAASTQAWLAHDLLGLTHVAAIAFAGTLAMLRQQRWIAELCGSPREARRVVLLWLAINLAVGAQLTWNLRPWFGSPGMPIEFLREHPFEGTFYESVFRMLAQRFD